MAGQRFVHSRRDGEVCTVGGVCGVHTVRGDSRLHTVSGVTGGCAFGRVSGVRSVGGFGGVCRVGGVTGVCTKLLYLDTLFLGSKWWILPRPLHPMRNRGPH